MPCIISENLAKKLPKDSFIGRIPYCHECFYAVVDGCEVYCRLIDRRIWKENFCSQGLWKEEKKDG